MATDARDLLPLKPLVFQVLLALSHEERHGWSLVREAQEHLGERILPANFYRTLRTMLSDGLITETEPRRIPVARERSGASGPPRVSKPGGVQGSPPMNQERRRYFKLTTLGQDAARLEARRLHELVSDSRTRRLLSTK